MELIRGLHNLRNHHRGCVATIGNFDGVHLGHQRILQQVSDKAREMNLPAVAIIFEPQPQEFFQGDQAPARLTRFRDKCIELQRNHIDRVCCLNFNQSLRSLTAEAFIEQLLLNGLDVKHFVVGDDFRFGCDRKGDFALLQAFGRTHGFTVENTATCEVDGSRVSSTRVREALASYDFALTEKLLGRPYTLSGKVMHGRQLGRQLNAPTANLSLKGKRLPFSGVFAIRATCADGSQHRGIANVGVRPTLDGEFPLLEVHLFDFNRSIYGQRLTVEFTQFVRPEQRFDGVEALQKQIHKDIAQVKESLQG